MIPISKKFKHLRENENVKNLDKIGCDYWYYNKGFKILQELLDKAAVGFKVWLLFWRSSTKYKDECHREFVPERKNQSRWQISLLC